MLPKKPNGPRLPTVKQTLPSVSPCRDDPNLEFDHLPGDGRPSALKAQETLQGILHYYQRTSGVGHTRSLFSGLGFIMGGPERPTVVVNQEQLGKMISPGKYITLERLPKWGVSERQPLIWDNSAVILLCQAALDEIQSLERKLQEAKTLVMEASSNENRPRRPYPDEGVSDADYTSIEADSGAGRLLEG